MIEKEFVCDKYNLRCIEPPCRTLKRCPYFDGLPSTAARWYSRVCKERQGALSFLDDDMKTFPALSRENSPRHKTLLCAVTIDRDKC